MNHASQNDPQGGPQPEQSTVKRAACTPPNNSSALRKSWLPPKAAPSPISRVYSPSALGKLVRMPIAGDQHSAFFPSAQLYSIFCPWGFKGTSIPGPGFSSFMVIQLPPRAKECLKKSVLSPTTRISETIQRN